MSSPVSDECTGRKPHDMSGFVVARLNEEEQLPAGGRGEVVQMFNIFFFKKKEKRVDPRRSFDQQKNFQHFLKKKRK